MVKTVFWLVSVVILCDTFVFSQIIIPVFHPNGGREVKCALSANATDDYYEIRDFIFTFLETAETDLRMMNVEEKMNRCQLAKETLSTLVAKGKKDWENCLTYDFLYFGDFVNDTLQNFLDFFCEKSNENIEGYFTEEAKECRAAIKKPLFDNCLVSLLATDHKPINYDLSLNTYLIPGKKDDLCRKLLDIGPCTTDILESRCPRLPSYQQLSGKLFAQTVKPCDEFYSFLSVARVVGITLTTISVAVILVVRFCPVRKWITDFRHRATSKTLGNSVI